MQDPNPSAQDIIETARRLDLPAEPIVQDGRPVLTIDTLDQAMSVLYGHGMQDDQAGAADEGGHYVRVGRFVQVADEQGFTRTTEYESVEDAEGVLAQQSVVTNPDPEIDPALAEQGFGHSPDGLSWRHGGTSIFVRPVMLDDDIDRDEYCGICRLYVGEDNHDRVVLDDGTIVHGGCREVDPLTNYAWVTRSRRGPSGDLPAVEPTSTSHWIHRHLSGPEADFWTGWS